MGVWGKAMDWRAAASNWSWAVPVAWAWMKDGGCWRVIFWRAWRRDWLWGSMATRLGGWHSARRRAVAARWRAWRAEAQAATEAWTVDGATGRWGDAASFFARIGPMAPTPSMRWRAWFSVGSWPPRRRSQ